MKRLLVILLTVVMLVSMLTVGVSAKTVTDQEPNDWYGAAQPIALGDTVTGNLHYENEESYDLQDCYALTLTEKTKVTVTMKADNGECSPMFCLMNDGRIWSWDLVEYLYWNGSEYEYVAADRYLSAGTWYIDPCIDGYGSVDYTLTVQADPGTEGWEFDSSAQEWYYVKNGAPASGWVKDSRGWAYVENGFLVEKGWYEDGADYSYVGEDGYLANYWWLEDGADCWAYIMNGKPVKNKWVHDGWGWYYQGADGYSVIGKWMKDSKGWVYLDDYDGCMVTNAVVADSAGLCLVGADGYMVKNKWVYAYNYAEGENWYDEDLYSWYHSDKNGYIEKSKWIADSKGWCYVDDTGRMVTNDIVKDSKGYCVVGDDGYIVYDKWIDLGDGDWIHVNKNGYIDFNKWVKDSKGWCYVGSSALMVTNWYAEDSKGTCWLGSDGYMVKDIWIYPAMYPVGGYMYFGKDGYLVKNQWVRDDEYWCYQDKNGYSVCNQWMKDSIGWVYLQNDGTMATNTFVKDGAGWCYVGEDGYCVTNTIVQFDNGYEFYFDASGHYTGNDADIDEFLEMLGEA